MLFEQYDAGTLIEELRAASPSAAAWLADNQFDPTDPVRLELGPVTTKLCKMAI